MTTYLFNASVRRSERDAVRTGVENCAGLSVLGAGSDRSDFVPRLDDASLTVLPNTASSVSIPARSFDRAIRAQVLPHMPGPDRRSAYLHEIACILKPGGRLIATATHFDFRLPRKGAPKEGWEEGAYFEASGRPVVATNVVGMPELVNENCVILTRPRDPATLSEALEPVLNRPSDEQAIVAHSHRSWEDVGKELFAICEPLETERHRLAGACS